MSKMKILSKLFILAAMLFASNTVAYALQLSYYTSESKLSKGHWAKVKVTKNGISQITYEQLRQAGFSNPEKVAVFGYGGVLLSKDEFSSSHPDDLKQIYALHKDNKILFYSEPDVRFRLNSSQLAKADRNYQANEGYYFITDSQPVMSPNTVKYIAYSEPNDINTHLAIQFSQPDSVNLTSGGARFFSRNGAEGSKKGIYLNFDVSDRSEGAQVNCCVDLILTNTKAPCNVGYEFNNVSLNYRRTQTSGLYDEKSSGILTVTDENIVNRNNQIRAVIYPTNEDRITYCGYNYISLVYERDNTLGSRSQLPMSFWTSKVGSRYLVSDVDPDNCQVWIVKDPTETRPMELKKLADNQVAFTLDKIYSGSGDAAYISTIAFNPAKEQFSTEIVENYVDHQNIHGEKTPDMLIITTDVCEEQALRLADLHKQYQGLDVLVVNQRKVFNEFSSGTPSVMAYRRLVKMFYDRNSSKFKNLLIFGAGTFDNRFRLSGRGDLSLANMALTYQCMDMTKQRTAETNYGNDGYFGCVSDNYVSADNAYHNSFIEMQVGVGRIPADTKEKARNYVDKVEKHLTQRVPFGAYSKAIIISDDGDSDSHAIYADAAADSILKSDSRMTVGKIYDGFYKWDNGSAAEARRQIIANLTDGTNLFFYTGHGKPDAFTAENIWHRNYVTSTNYDYAPMAFLSTCYSLCFDRQDNGIAENMLFTPNGGNIAVIGAGRSVYADSNQKFALAFIDALSSATRDNTIGDVYRTSRNSACENTVAHRVNTYCYNLIGDPALLIDRPNYSVTLAEVNGEAYNSDVKLTLDPQTSINLAGNIVDNSGKVAENFNGTLTIAVYEGPTTLSNLYQDKSTTNQQRLKTISVDETLIAQFTASVTNGKFNKTIVLPAPSRCGNKNRLVIGACSDDAKDIALGAITNVAVNNYNPDIEHIEDTDVPEVYQMYINSPEFSNGDLITNSAHFYASIYDQSGINISSNGAALKLVLDGIKSFEFVSQSANYDENGVLHLNYDLNDLSDGQHTIKLQVADNAGNYTEKELSFTFVKVSPSSLNVEEEPAKTEATLNLTHSLTGDVTTSLVIETIDGKTVFTKENVTFPYAWNLKDNAGNDVPNGNYRAFTKTKSSLNNHTVADTEIIVIR